MESQNNSKFYIDNGQVYRRITNHNKKRKGAFWRNLEKFKKQTLSKSANKNNT